jgi:subtilisin family serine protease
MKAIRSSLQLATLIALSFALTAVEARADANSVALINATNGPLDAYTGQGVVIGQVELAVPDTNQVYLLNQFINTTNFISGTAGTWGSGHATQVAGVMVSTNPATIGVAVGAKVYSVSGLFGPDPVAGPTNDDLEFQTNVINAATFLASQPNVRVISMSIGLDSVTNNRTTGIAGRAYNTSGTSVWERALDNLVATKSVSIVMAAGNEGNNRGVGANSLGGTNTLGEQAGAYNIITVGSVNDAAPGTATNVSAFSSRGYLTNGRSALDILAVGEGITMPQTNGTFAGGGTNTKVNNGTSFATPAVSAVIARLIQASSNRFTAVPNVATEAQDPRMMKAFLLNSATKLPGWGQGSVFGGTPGLTGSLTGAVTTVTQPLDPNQGAGLLNANGAYSIMNAGIKSPTFQSNGMITSVNPPVTPTGWDFNTVKLSLTNIYQVSGQVSGSMAITLDWNRDVGATVAGTNSILGMANLDLYLFSSPDSAFTNASLTAQSISSVDNLEHLWFTNLPTAYYEFEVGYTGYDAQAGPTVMNEQYGLAWTFTVPEPSTLLLAVLGVSTLWWQKKRKQHV